MTLSIVVAIDQNNLIGNQNKIPWHLPKDLQYFQSLTTGFPVIMGRKTFESIGKPLTKRTNIIVTRQNHYQVGGCKMARSLPQAIEIACEANRDKSFIIGGEEIYRQALTLTDKVYLTQVHADFTGDTYFPGLDTKEWKLIGSIQHEADLNNAIPFDHLCYQRISTN